jgi:hypothetical protein
MKDMACDDQMGKFKQFTKFTYTLDMDEEDGIG